VNILVLKSGNVFLYSNWPIIFFCPQYIALVGTRNGLHTFVPKLLSTKNVFWKVMIMRRKGGWEISSSALEHSGRHNLCGPRLAQFFIKISVLTLSNLISKIENFKNKQITHFSWLPDGIFVCKLLTPN
jgi:hypothetical protein